MASYRISELLKYRPSAKEIRDYAKVTEIFRLYLEGKFETMTMEIIGYGDFEFFDNIMKFLIINFNKESWQNFIHKDMSDEYNYLFDKLNIVYGWQTRKKTRRSVSY